MEGKVTITDLLETEAELDRLSVFEDGPNTASCWASLVRCISVGTMSSLERDAKVNLLRYLQVQTVRNYEQAYDDLYYNLNKIGKLDCVKTINPRKAGSLLQPKVLQDYHADAKRAKPCLDSLIRELVEDTDGCEAIYAEVKSPQSVQRKAQKSCGGNIRKVADMARVAVVCDDSEALQAAHTRIIEKLQVGRAPTVPGHEN